MNQTDGIPTIASPGTPVPRESQVRRPASIPAGMNAPTVRCRECGRTFDLTNLIDAAEWHYGHDCEA